MQPGNGRICVMGFSTELVSEELISWFLHIFVAMCCFWIMFIFNYCKCKQVLLMDILSVSCYSRALVSKIFPGNPKAFSLAPGQGFRCGIPVILDFDQSQISRTPSGESLGGSLGPEACSEDEARRGWWHLPSEPPAIGIWGSLFGLG